MQLKKPVSGTQIQRVDSTKFFGLTIDENLSWEKQVKNVSRRQAKYVSVMYRMSEDCNKKKTHFTLQ